MRTKFLRVAIICFALCVCIVCYALAESEYTVLAVFDYGGSGFDAGVDVGGEAIYRATGGVGWTF